MREDWIIQSKLAAPTPPVDWLERELTATLPAAVVLVGGAGDGKTLGALSLARRLTEQGALLLWLSADTYDTDAVSFFYYLLAGMRKHIPQFGEDVQSLLMAGEAEPRQLWQRFFRAVATYNLPGLAVVLDDAHHLDGELLAALGYHLDKLPPRTHLLLASRRQPNFPTAKLKAKNLLELIGPERLRFSPTETETFLKARTGGTVPASWREAADRLEGWPLGLDLLAADPDSAGRLAGAAQGAVSAYVAEELYQSQTAAVRDFMVKIALLAEITPEACRWVLQAPDAAERLEALEADHLLQRLSEGAGYRFPAYLLDFLHLEAARALSGLTLAAYHRRAASYYQDAGAEELALPHLIASKDWAGAAVACDLSFPAMRFSGRHAQIERRLAEFPPEAAAEEPVVQLWRGHLLSRKGQSAEAVPAYEAARRLYRDRDDAPGEFKALIRLYQLAVRAQETKRANQLGLQAQALQDLAEAEDLVDLHIARAWAADLRGDGALMKECNEAALSVPVGENVEIAASQILAHLNLYTHAYHLGELAAASRHAEQAGAIASDWGFRPYQLYAGFLGANVKILQGDHEAAGGFFRGLDPNWQDLLDWLMAAVAHTLYGNYHAARGDHKEAEASYGRALDIFERSYPEGKKVVLEGLAWVGIQRKQYARVEAMLAEVLGDEVRNFYDLALVLPRARARLAADDAQGALDVITPALAEAERLEAWLLLTKALAVSASARQALKDPAATSDRTRARALADLHHYHFLPTQDPTLWPALEAPAAPKKAAPDVLEKVVPPAGRLELRCFGGFEVRLDGVLLDHWPRRKAKLILAALALQGKELSSFSLAELVGDGDAVSGQAILKVSVPVLRRTLEPELKQGNASRFVLLKDDGYSLAWGEVGAIDLQAFEAALKLAEAARDADPVQAAAAYERALGLYRGPLFDEPLLRDFFEPEREKYRQQAVGALTWLASHHAQRMNKAAAEAAMVRVTELAPTEEQGYLALMRQYVVDGRPEKARQAYWDCRKAMKQHLSETPSEEFEASAKMLLGGPSPVNRR